MENEEYIEINLKDILFYILRRWKPILAVAVSMALLLGGLKAFKEYKLCLKAAGSEAFWEEYQNYQDELCLYEKWITATQDKIDTLQFYLDHSILMGADYRNIYEAKATYYIETNYKIIPENNYQDPDKTYTLAWYYQEFLTDYSIFEELGKEMGVDAKYLEELVSVYTVSNNTVALSVSHPDKASAQMILSALQEKLNAVYDDLNSTVEAHTLTLMMDTCGTYIDEDLKDEQQWAHEELLSYQDELVELKQELRELKEDGGLGKPQVFVAFVKWCIMGGIAGGFLAVMFFFVKAFIVNRVYSPDQLVSSYHIPVLGCTVHGSKKLDAISLWLRKLEGRPEKKSEESLQFLAVNIENHCNGAKKVLVCSDINTEESSLLVESLNSRLQDIQLIAAGNLLRDADALRMLAQCDAVLLIVTGDQSFSKNIRKELRLIQECGKSAIGFVFTD